MVTQCQLITHRQTLVTNLASLDTIIEQVLNDGHAMVELK
jgi:hypothetical protein